MITVMLYSRQNCHLCEVAKEELDSLQDELPHKLVVVDVDQDPQLRQTFRELVPVVTVGSLPAPGAF
jgi:thiol-disulfide isomerase/thioredoxin